MAGVFTVESLSALRVLAMGADDELVDRAAEPGADYGSGRDFVSVILDCLPAAGVQQAQKADRIDVTSLVPWPGDLVCGEGRCVDGTIDRRAAIFIGSEFGTMSRADLVAAAQRGRSRSRSREGSRSR